MLDWNKREGLSLPRSLLCIVFLFPMTVLLCASLAKYSTNSSYKVVEQNQYVKRNICEISREILSKTQICEI